MAEYPESMDAHANPPDPPKRKSPNPAGRPTNAELARRKAAAEEAEAQRRQEMIERGEDPDSPEEIRKRNRKGRRASLLRRLSTMRIPEEKLQEMFMAYCQMPNYSYVARRCGVTMTTVKRYAAMQEWELRRDKIMRQAREHEDYPVQKATEESIRMIRTLKRKIEAAIEGLSPADMTAQQIAQDLERMVKLEQVIMGNFGERQEIIVSSHEERIRKLRESRGTVALPEHTEQVN